MSKKEVVSYVKKMFKDSENNPDKSQNVYAIVYGSILGPTSELYIACDIPQKIPEPENGLKVNAYTPDRFGNVLKLYCKNWSALQVVEIEKIVSQEKHNNLHFWNDNKIWMKKFSKYQGLDLLIEDF